MIDKVIEQIIEGEIVDEPKRKKSKGGLKKGTKTGKLNIDKAVQAYAAGKKRKEIARAAGSLATSEQGLYKAASKLMSSEEFKVRAHNVVERTFEKMTDEKLENTNAVGLATIVEKMGKVSGLAEVGAGEEVTPRVVINVDKILQYYANKE